MGSSTLPRPQASPALTRLQAEVRDQSAKLRAAEERLADATQQLDALRRQLAEREDRIRRFEADAKRAEELEASSWDAADGESPDAAPDIASHTKPLEKRIEELREQLAEQMKHVAERDAKLADRDARIAEQKTRIAEQKTHIADRDAKLADRDAKLADRDARIAALEAAPKPAAPAADDFTRIKGIGPKFARALDVAGVHSFAQMASWSDDDVETIAQTIRTTAGRIRRDRWIERARGFAAEAAAAGSDPRG